MKTNNRFKFLLILVVLLSGFLLVILVRYTSELESQIQFKDSIIEQYEGVDSLLCAKEREYITIKEQVYLYQGEEISSDELVQLFGEVLTENDRLKAILESIRKDYGRLYSAKIEDNRIILQKHISRVDTALIMLPYLDTLGDRVSNLEKELIKAKDSLKVYRAVINIVSRDYDLEYNISKEGDNWVINRPSYSKVDTALSLLPYFRHRISQGEDGQWAIEVDAESSRKSKRK